VDTAGFYAHINVTHSNQIVDLALQSLHTLCQKDGLTQPRRIRAVEACWLYRKREEMKSLPCLRFGGFSKEEFTQLDIFNVILDTYGATWNDRFHRMVINSSVMDDNRFNAVALYAHPPLFSNTHLQPQI